MERAEYERMYALEGRHFWFVAKRRLVRRLLERAVPGARRVLDVGCGTGQTLSDLPAPVRCGVDRERLALGYTRSRGLACLARADATALPFAGGCFDAVLLLDVLYHRAVADEARALREVVRVLRPGGALIVTDSALELLRSPHDQAVHGKRRYTAGQMRALLEEAGFSVEKCSYTNFALLPAVLAVRMAHRLHGSPGAAASDLKPLPGPLNAALKAVCTVEAEFAARADLPIGSSVVAVARRPPAA